MQTQNRAAPHFLLALLTLLSVGAILFSLTKAPPVAQTQLREAAANTAAASSFRLAYIESAAALSAPAAKPASRSEAVVVYQAPDRVEDTVAGRQTVTGLVIGFRHYRRVGSGPWQYLGTTASASGTQVADDIVLPLELVGEATGVEKDGSGIYSFTPGNSRQLLITVFGAQLTSIAPTSVSYKATVAGEYLSVLQISLANSSQRVTADLVFGDVGRAPALEAPTGAG
jgi:hypothetical protein